MREPPALPAHSTGAMSRPVPVLINRSGGTAAAFGYALLQCIEDAFADTGRDVAIEIHSGIDIAEAVARHADSPLVIVGGGDGTLSAAASVLAGRRGALGILPLGTRNNLARQLGVPLALAEAARVAVRGQRKRIDLGAAGARIFVNNASFGIYTRFVQAREGMRGSRWFDTVPAMMHVLRHMRAQQFPLRINGLSRTLVTPLLFVGNNEYAIDPGHLGERASLTDGELSVYAVAAQQPLGLIGFAARALLGLARPERDFQLFAAAREIVLDGEGWVEGAFDGEIEVMPLPMVIRSLPGALGVVLPREAAGDAMFAKGILTDRTL